jgi:hypothetical protein
MYIYKILNHQYFSLFKGTKLKNNNLKFIQRIKFKCNRNN